MTDVAIRRAHAWKPAFYGIFMRIVIPLFASMRIRILLLIKMMGNLRLLFGRPSGLFWAPRPQLCERPRLYCEPLKLRNFYFNADPDQAFFNPDPASKNNEDPRGSGSVTVEETV